MSTDSLPTRRAENPRPHSFWTGRSEFAVVALLYAIAVFLTVGTVTMKVMGSSVPGPQFFPIIVCILLYGSATALAFNIIRHPKVSDTAAHPGHGDFSPDMLRDLGDLSDNSDPLPPSCSTDLGDAFGLEDRRASRGCPGGVRTSARDSGLDTLRRCAVLGRGTCAR